MPPKIVVITGPTATGKTRLGVLLCRKTGGEVVSADSMQIYRGMDIGTAKPTAAEMEGVAHHMMGVVSPQEQFSVSRYVDMAAACTDDILKRGKLPFLVGGTGLYIDSLISGRNFAHRAGDGELRCSLGAKYEALGGEKMLEMLAERDPETATRLHPNDKKRIVRALEVLELTGKTISEHDRETRLLPNRYDALKIALTFADREELYRRIDLRVDMMMDLGLEAEVRALLAGGLSTESTAMQAIGYKELAAAIEGKCTVSEAVESIKRESRRYAKRQLSWLRRDESVHWIFWEKEPDYEKAIQSSTALLEEYGIISA
ncbi:MAG: tRNA (adenosine(37)-N6)-dimethylallyltransferase MiaA [Clostridiales bacterium]|nr:tRNA (adenosine(37)-N6)-dimethylallyltransferase MiaA [Clostridiales bacterium]